ASGPIKGVAAEGVHEFLGIPFAAPPVGPLRWKSPQQPQSWSTVRPATTAASICPQDLTPSAGNSDDEDCLYLNVYAPPPSARAKPVMVWFHGGSFVSGGSTQYDPSVLAAKGDVVVVTAKYRMGPFGFLALPSLDAESPDHTSGDLGLADQQAAMKWAR